MLAGSALFALTHARCAFAVLLVFSRSLAGNAWIICIVRELRGSSEYGHRALSHCLQPMSLRKTSARENVPVWVYVIFRKNPSSGHDKVSVNVSNDGPVFWTRHVVYVFCCSCHFERHEVSTRERRSPRHVPCLVNSIPQYRLTSESLVP